MATVSSRPAIRDPPATLARSDCGRGIAATLRAQVGTEKGPYEHGPAPVDLLVCGAHLAHDELGHRQCNLSFAGEHGIGARLAQLTRFTKVGCARENANLWIQLARSFHHGVSRDAGRGNDETIGLFNACMMQDLALGSIRVDRRFSFGEQLLHGLQIGFHHYDLDAIVSQNSAQRSPDRPVANDDHAVGSVINFRRFQGLNWLRLA